MAEQTQQDGQKTIVAFVVGLLIGGMLVWAFSDPHTDHVDDMSPATVEVADDEANTDTEADTEPTPEDEADAPTTPTLPVGDGAVSVMNQPASLEVALDEAVFPVAEGWIGVRNYQNDQLGTILGVTRFSESQGRVPTSIPLQTPTIAGRQYAVVIFTENGDFSFNLAGDVQIDTIFATFTAE